MGVEGKLSDMPVVDLLRVFQRGANSGKLFVWAESAHAIMWLRDGQAVSAITLSRPSMRPLTVGEEAVFDLFTWPEGRFSFAPADNAESYPVMIKRSTNLLILKALQQRNTAPERRSGDSLTMQTSLLLTAQMTGASEKIQMSIEEWFVLTHIGPQATVGHLVQASGLPIERVTMAVQHLIDSGLVMRAPLTDLAVPQSAGTSFPNLIQAIRRRLQQTPTDHGFTTSTLSEQM